MDARYDQAPEVVAPETLPEVRRLAEGPQVPPQYLTPQQAPEALATKPEYPESPQSYGVLGGDNPTAPSTYGLDQQSRYLGAYSESSEPQRSSKAAAGGCSKIILLLSIIIAVLSAAIVALAATTGVEANRARKVSTNLTSLNSTCPTPAPQNTTCPSVAPVNSTSSDSTNSSNFDSLDKGCSTDPTGVSGTKYTSQFYYKSTYTIWCNFDTANSPLQSLFVGTFDDCMDACASYSYYISSGSNETNQACAGVSFIPLWTNRTVAIAGSAPGNCYLKPGPQNKTALTSPYIGTECHAAILYNE